MESIDKLPLGIYKSIMAKAYRSLNNPIQYPYYNELNGSNYNNKHIAYSPTSQNDLFTNKKGQKNNARENFFIDYIKDK
jgi:hypothetical protein